MRKKIEKPCALKYCTRELSASENRCKASTKKDIMFHIAHDYNNYLYEMMSQDT